MSKLLISLMLLMTLAEFRARDESAQVYMVIGATQMTIHAGVKCREARTVGELKAALKFRQLDLSKPWIEHLTVMMKDNQCEVEQEKGDT